jgi:hypothetical protein
VPFHRRESNPEARPLRDRNHLLSGYAPTPIRRVGRWADGFIDLIRGFGEGGADEVCWPTVAELDQVDRLAESVA